MIPSDPMRNLGPATILRADARTLPLADNSVDLVCTSPPYFSLRSYQDGGEHYAGQLGSEATPAEFVDALIDCTREMVRVVKPSGSIWVNLGDTYSRAGGGGVGSSDGTTGRGSRPARKPTPIPTKSLSGIPWRYALRCIDDLGLILRAHVVWSKPNGLPESVTDRVRRSHEDWFHFSLEPRYYSAVDEIREPHNPNTHARGKGGAMERDGDSLPTWGINGTQSLRGVDKRYVQDPLGKLPGSVWTVPTEPLRVPDHLGIDHFAAFPSEWPKRIIRGWSPAGVCTACGEGRRPVVPRERYGTALRAAREAAKLSRQDVANNLGCHVRSLSDWEDEGHLPSVSAWDALSDMLGIGLSRSQFVATYDYVDTGSGDTDLRRRAEAAGAATYARKKNTIARHATGHACACPEPTADTTPAIVLDPFGGTGTVAMVARALGRHGVHVDLSSDYNRLAHWRITDLDQLAAVQGHPRTKRQPDDQPTLLDALEDPA